MATFTQMKDDMRTCPYNPLHKVAARRLQAHIVKCARNPCNPVLETCPFNALHKMPREELQQHILLCKDSRQVIREIDEARHRPALNTPVVYRTELPPSSDDWDDDYDKDGKTYVVPGLSEDPDDDEDSEKDFRILSNIQVQRLAPAQRKKYYKELAEKARSKELPEIKSEIRIKEESERPSTSSSSRPQSSFEEEDHPNNVRIPTTMPFKNKMTGVGRGNTPLSNRMGIRSVGASFSPSLTNSFVKRERDEEISPSRGKRFSPDPQ